MCSVNEFCWQKNLWPNFLWVLKTEDFSLQSSECYGKWIMQNSKKPRDSVLQGAFLIFPIVIYEEFRRKQSLEVQKMWINIEIEPAVVS
jgi:hypothetical protein